LLRADHRKVEELFSQYEAQEGQAQDSVIRHICQELEVHARLEEEIFYPAVRAAGAGEAEDLVSEAVTEHQKIKDLVARLDGMAPDDMTDDDTVRQLKECVSHHVREEESEMLPKAEQLLGEQLAELGTQLQQRKQQLMEAAPESDEGQAPEQYMPQTS
jgi:hemerythrin-like domain-containing protein